MNGFLRFLGSKPGKWSMIVIFGIISFLILFAMANSGTDAGIIIAMVLWTVVGWRTISFLQPDTFIVILGSVGVVFYFVAKIILSVLLGLVCVPYSIGKFISEKIQNIVNNGEIS